VTSDPRANPTGPAGHLSSDTVADLDAELLDTGARAEAEAHLAGCAECRAERAALGELRGLLRSVAVSEPVPADVAVRLRAALERESLDREHASAGPLPDPVRLERRRSAVLPRLLAAAAAFAAIGGVGYLAITAGSPSDDTSTSEAGTASLADSPADSSASGGGQLAAVAAATREVAGSGTRGQGTAAGSEASPPAGVSPDDGTADASEAPLAASGPEGAATRQLADTCGTSLAGELDRTLVGARAFVYDGREVVLVVLSGPTASLVSGYVVPDCDAESARVLTSVDVPKE